jgi:hypothetical protein
MNEAADIEYFKNVNFENKIEVCPNTMCFLSY